MAANEFPAYGETLKSIMIPDMKKVLVAGGAGYIGSLTVRGLLEAGYQPVVLDNLSTGKREAVPEDALFHQGEIADRALLDTIFTRHAISAVMLFAAKIKVGESVHRPDLYYNNNVGHALPLLDAMLRHGCPALIFSSTAAVYGNPRYLPIDEQHPANPINPYGWSKLMLETILRDYCSAFPLKAVVLRYFNAAGAALDGLSGESADVKQNLIPIAIDNLEKGIPTDIFGGDWDTPDHTPIRDYLHIHDIANGHLSALQLLLSGKAASFDVFNLGGGIGISVLEVLNALARASGKTVPHRVVGRRAGDAGHLVASHKKAEEILEWKPAHSGIDTIISSAYRWHTNRKY